MKELHRNWTDAGLYLLLGVLFAIAYGQTPLYSNTQNTYFLHGLAQAGYGMLSESFMAQTADPFPLFSLLVRLTVSVNPFLFHVYFVLLCTVYVNALLGIVIHVFGVARSSLLYYGCFAALVTIHSGGISSPFLWLQRGVATQYLLGTELLPNVFGVFLVLSIERFLANRPLAAVLALGVACAFHSTYLLGSAMLTLAYMGITILERGGTRRAILIGLGALVVVFPVVTDVLIRFGPVSSDVQRVAQEILVDLRLPHHARPDVWIGLDTLKQLLVILLGTVIVRRTRLFWILVTATGLSIGLTVLQVALDSDWLALMFPWRISAVLVPVAATVTIAWLGRLTARQLGWMLAPHRRVIVALIVLLVAGNCLVGGLNTVVAAQARRTDPAGPMMDYVRTHLTPGDLYLIPVDMLDFQLTTGAPALADWKTHPYRPAEVIEWYERVQTAREFYESTDHSCETLDGIRHEYHVTQVVLAVEQQVECSFAQTVYVDERFRVLQLESVE